MAGNDALDINPPNATYHLSTHGSDWLWAAFSIFGLSLLIAVALAFRVCILSWIFLPYTSNRSL